MEVKDHYELHLGKIYSWMSGDLQVKSEEFLKFLCDNSIQPTRKGVAVDLGSGHGIQSIALAKLGYRVHAIDFNQYLLNELLMHAQEYDITAIHDDLRNFRKHVSKADLIVCAGDTVTHLENKSSIVQLIEEISNALETNGKVVLSFRNYSNKLYGTDRIIPVKNDENRILTCLLEYEERFVNVTDLIHERTKNGWIQTAGTYRKTIISEDEVLECLGSNQLKICTVSMINGMTHIIAEKG